jgi:cytoskeletal protein CcmA (bactofilin family)
MPESDPGPQEATALVREGARFEGLVVADGPARIDGRVSGEVLAIGLLWIGENGWVRAQVRADELVVAGRLEGSASASSRIELLPSAQVRAELSAPQLVFAEGSVFQGRCHSRPPAAPASP